MHVPLIAEADGPLLMIGLEHAAEVTSALAIAGVEFEELDQEGAGCAGPNLLVLRLAPHPDAQRRVDLALAHL